MHVVVFDVRGSIAHFRRPDTVVTHCSYPFMTRTALTGLVCAILGRQQLDEEHWFGLRLMKPVNSSFQEMSMLGKGWLGGGSTFNRPTAIELIVNPHYRVYYSGASASELATMIQDGRSAYTTYLGSAFCITRPEFVALEEFQTVEGDCVVSTLGVVPAHIIGELLVEPGSQYARCDGVRYRQVEDRVFDGVIDFVYETSGRPIRFRPRVPLNLGTDIPARLVSSDAGCLCLW